MATQIIEVHEASPPRRQFSADDKARVVSEAMMAGSSVTAVARRHRICASLIYRWRRELLGGEPVERPASSFVPVEVAAAPASRSASSSPGDRRDRRAIGSHRAADPADRCTGAEGGAGIG